MKKNECYSDTKITQQNIIMIDERIIISNALIDTFKKYGNNWEFLSFTTVSEAIEKTYQINNVLFLLNIGGIDFTEKTLGNYIGNIRKVFSSTPIILLADNEDLLKVQLFSYLKLNGFITMNSSPQLLVSCMQLVISGGVYIPETLILNHLSINSPSFEIEDKGKIEKLTKRQKEVAVLLQHGLLNKVIASKLKISESTVKKHISNIMDKLKVNNRVQIVKALSKTA